MTEMDVNKRPTLRDEQAEVTRRRITEAARALFGARGYGATTLQAIAGEAGVAVQTVYAIYRSKAGVLRALREAVVVQPEAAELYRQAIAADTAERKLELFSRSIARRWESGSDVVRFHVEAASTDPSVRTEVDEVLARRRGGIDRFAASLEGSLAPGLDVAAAVALIDALTMPEVYHELTAVHGWTPDRYEGWLARSLKGQLLGS
jgi:AcrR family transcriptional regulator